MFWCGLFLFCFFFKEIGVRVPEHSSGMSLGAHSGVGSVSCFTACHKRMQLIVSVTLALREATAVQGIGSGGDPYLSILVLRKSVSYMGELANEHIVNLSVLLELILFQEHSEVTLLLISKLYNES